MNTIFRATDRDLIRVSSEIGAHESGRASGYRIRYILGHYFEEPAFWKVSVAGASGLAIAILSYFTVPDQNVFTTIVFIVVVVGACGFMFAPAAHALWLARIIEHGALSVGRVISVNATEGRDEISGSLVVEHPMGSFVEDFTETASRAAHLLPGVEVEVVVERQRPRLLLVLGPARTS